MIVGLQSPDGYYNLTNGTLKVNYSEIIGLGTGSYGLFDQKNGTHTISGNLYLGRNQGGYGSFSLSTVPDPNNPDAPTPPEVGLLDVHGFASWVPGRRRFPSEGRHGQDQGHRSGYRQSESKGPPGPVQANPVQNLGCSQRNYVGFTIGRGGLGSYGLENGELLVSRGEVIGLYKGSDGFFRHASGRHFVGETLTIARDTESIGLYDFYDGMLTAWGGIVNNGTFNFYGGTIQGKFSNNHLFNAETKRIKKS